MVVQQRVALTDASSAVGVAFGVLLVFGRELAWYLDPPVRAEGRHAEIAIVDLPRAQTVGIGELG